MGDPNVPLGINPIPSFCRKESFRRTYLAIDNAIRHDDVLYLIRYLQKLEQKKYEILQCSQELEGQYYAVNLSGDPLLSVLISYEKTKLAQKLLRYIGRESLLEANLQGNTALHVAAAVGVKVMGIADELIHKNASLLNTRNKNNETPLLRAALYGQQKMFWMLYERGDKNIIEFRRQDGSNVLHCAIMGNAPGLALDIAARFPGLKTRRNVVGATPLQLMVTIPAAFKSKMEFGLLESFIYKCENKYPPRSWRQGEGDASFAIEVVSDPGLAIDGVHPVNQHDEENLQLLRTKTLLLYLLKLAKIPAGRAILPIFWILKQIFPALKYLEQQKRNHKETMELIEFLAGDDDYWDFIGRTAQFDESRSFSAGERPIVDDEPPINDESRSFSADKPPIVDDRPPIVDAALQRWNDSPLITCAKMGLHEFVDKILEVYPQSVYILDAHGKNILQVAILVGSHKIFELVTSKLTGRNTLLPSRLLYARDNKKNTILHYAAEVTVDLEMASTLQMLKDLQWFEKVRKFTPMDLQYSCNVDEMTALECFLEKHQVMARKSKLQLTQLGQTFASLVVAFIFTSIFSIPASDESGGSSSFYGKAVFMVLKSAYAFGLSCAATALALFLSLSISSIREHEFRRSTPTNLIIALLSFFLALISLLVAFACNIFLLIYRGRRIGAKELITFVCELTFFPVLTLIMRQTWIMRIHRAVPLASFPLFSLSHYFRSNT